MVRSTQQYEARARIAKALAERDLCVGELTDLVGSDQSTVSKHLAILKEAGFLRVEKRGEMNCYSIRCICLDQFFNCIESVLQQNLREQQEFRSVLGIKQTMVFTSLVILMATASGLIYGLVIEGGVI